MKYFIAMLILVCLCSVAWAEELTAPGTPADYVIHEKLNKLEDTLDKIFSMVFDLETKFMGVDRAEQIGMPDLHAQKLADKMMREQIGMEKENYEIPHPLPRHTDRALHGG